MKHEYKCFLGMEKTISMSNPLILFECMSKNDNKEIYSFLKTHGYRIFIIDDNENQLEEIDEVNPILDDNNNLIHHKINRIAVPKRNVDLLKPFF